MMRFLSIVSFAALVAGCASSAVPDSAAMQAPQKARSGENLNYPLLYVADGGVNEVLVYSYPDGTYKFTLSGFGSANGVCADFNGDVYVSDGHDGELVEFAYASKKRLRLLKDPGYYLGGCSVEAISGDVAVATQGMGSNPGGVAIFRQGKGKPHNYTSASTYFGSTCTYDGKGNLYVDGTNINASFFVAELPNKMKTFKLITLDQSIVGGGGVQWDASHNLLAVDDQGVGYKGSTVDEFAIKGTTATEMGNTPLRGSSDVIGFTLVQYSNTASKLVGANLGTTPSVMYWSYPKGGKPSKTLTGFTDPVSVAIAAEPSAAHGSR